MKRVFLGWIILLFTQFVQAAGEIGIRIAYPSGMNGQIPVVMERAGIAKQYKLDAEYAFFQNGPPMMEALASGNVDAVITSLMPITSFLSKQPGKAVVVAQLGASSHSLMVPKDSPVKSVRDLKGKTVAVSFSTDSHLDLLRQLKESGLNATKDVTLINVPPNELPLSLSQGYSDAIVIRVPQVERAQDQFGARIVYSWPFRFAVVMRTEYLARNPNALTRFIDALEASVLYTSHNRQKAAKWFAEKLRMDAKTVLEATGHDPIFNATRLDQVDVRITPQFRKTFESWVAASLDSGLIKTPVNINAAFASQ